jgi:5'-nucleotidase
MPEDAGPLLVLTNDDGVDAPGLEALRQAVRNLAPSKVIAPCGPISGCGHRVTTHEPIAVLHRREDCLAVSGTPVDCVRLAVHHLAKGLSWVLSGVNAGGNLGTDVYHSGTVAAAREAAIRGWPAIAVSHYIARGRSIDWEIAAARTARVLRILFERRWERGTFWNVNLPHPAEGSPEPEIVFCSLDPSPLPLDYRVGGGGAVYTGDYQKRERRPACDVATCFGGNISITLLRLDGMAEGSPASGPLSSFDPPRPRVR